MRQEEGKSNDHHDQDGDVDVGGGQVLRQHAPVFNAATAELEEAVTEAVAKANALALENEQLVAAITNAKAQLVAVAALALKQFKDPGESACTIEAARTTSTSPTVNHRTSPAATGTCYDLTISANGEIYKDSLKLQTAYHLLSADGKRALQASNNKSNPVLLNDEYFAGYSLAFGEDLQAPEASFSFSKGHTPGTHVIHSAAHENNTLYFLGGATCPREWVTWDKPEMKGDWEELELMWDGEGREKTFKIKGHNGQYVKWEEGGGGCGVFKASSEGEATKFILREAEG